MKKIKHVLSIFFCALLLGSFALPVFAASGITTDENAVYEHFVSVQNKYATLLGETTVNKNKVEAQRVLSALDFSKEACTDLDNTITKVDEYLASKDIKTKADLKAQRTEIVNIINKTASKYYSINVSLDTSGIGTVTFTIPSNGSNVPAQTETVTIGNNTVVKQTGVNNTATVLVLTNLAAVSMLGMGAAAFSTSKRFARH